MLSAGAEVDLLLENKQLRNKNITLHDENRHLRAKLQAALKQLYGTGKSEKIDPAQLLLFLEGLDDQKKEALEEEKEKDHFPGYDREKKRKTSRPENGSRLEPIRLNLERSAIRIGAERALAFLRK